MFLIDTHVHLHFPDFSEDSEQVITRAQEKGVGHFINVGTDLDSSKQAIEVAERYDFVHATVGIHPHDAKDATPEAIQEIGALAKHPKVVAIGEVGLDFYRNLSPEKVQREVIISFFKLAQELNLPLVLHIREAYPQMIELLKSEFTAPIRAVSHCFAGDVDAMKQLVDLGLYISFAGPISYRKNDALREAAKFCPADRMVVETDAPYLAPQAFRGKRNEPAYMVETAKFLADARGESLEQVAEQTTQNARRLFEIE